MSTPDDAPGTARGTPWLLGVRCDRRGCDTTFEGDFLVAEDATPGERLRVVLDWVGNHGWRVIWRQPVKDSLTFCPDEASALTYPAGKDAGGNAR